MSQELVARSQRRILFSTSSTCRMLAAVKEMEAALSGGAGGSPASGFRHSSVDVICRTIIVCRMRMI